MSHFNESLLHCPEASDMGQDYSEEDSEMATSNAYMSFSNVFLQPHTPTQTRTNTDGTDTEASTLHSGSKRKNDCDAVSIESDESRATKRLAKELNRFSLGDDQIDRLATKTVNPSMEVLDNSGAFNRLPIGHGSLPTEQPNDVHRMQQHYTGPSQRRHKPRTHVLLPVSLEDREYDGDDEEDASTVEYLACPRELLPGSQEGRFGAIVPYVNPSDRRMQFMEQLREFETIRERHGHSATWRK
eukprot:m.89029 g.89029  ORF g.89029 m.89029 type:complete len:243 (+) comp13203_c0_seq5:463-1191(+)